MNINNLLKTSILACAMMVGINNNANAIDNESNNEFCYDDDSTYHTVNSKVFQHDVIIHNNSDWHLVEYVYCVPPKKQYVMNSHTGYFEEYDCLKHHWHLGEKYIAYADDPSEYDHKEYNCEVQHTYTSNKMDAYNSNRLFNELYKRKEINSNSKDVKTIFAEEVRKVFGSNYKVIEGEEDFSKILAKYPGNRIQGELKDGTKKDLIKLFRKHGSEYYSDEINELLIQNGFELTTKLTSRYGFNKNGYIVIQNNKCEEKILNMSYWDSDALNMRNIIITNGIEVICVFAIGRVGSVIKVYKRKDGFATTTKLKSGKYLINKLDKVMLVLQEVYKKELAIVKEVFGQDFKLTYI